MRCRLESEESSTDVYRGGYWNRNGFGIIWFSGWATFSPHGEIAFPASAHLSKSCLSICVMSIFRWAKSLNIYNNWNGKSHFHFPRHLNVVVTDALRKQTTRQRLYELIYSVLSISISAVCWEHIKLLFYSYPNLQRAPTFYFDAFHTKMLLA